MTSTITQSPRAGQSARRSRSLYRMISSSAFIGLLGYVLFAAVGAVDSGVPPTELDLTEIGRSTFRQQIERSGVIEPLKSDAVHSSCYWNTTILSIVPEGTWVQEGDVVCVLDSSEIEEYARTREALLIKYRSRLDNALHDQALLRTQNERKLSAAQFKLESATRDLAEYTDGTFPKELEEIETNLSFLAQQAESTVDEMQHTEQLWAMGIVGSSLMDQSRLELLQARQKYDEAEAKLKFLSQFSHPRSTMRLEYLASNAERNLARTKMTTGLAETNARLTTLSYERTLRIYERYYRRATDSIKACTLRAPCDGQVVYGNSWYLMSRGITQIEEGSRVRNLQKVFEIPDPKRMKVSVPLDESLIFQVSNGMPTTITLPGYDDIEIAGKVIHISRYPRQRSSMTPHLKDYWLDVELLPTAEQRDLLKVKADVKVTMTLSEIPDALQIPRHAVTGLAGHNFVYIYDGNELVCRKIQLGQANDNFVCVLEGLDAGEQLVTGMQPEHEEALEAVLRSDLGLTP